jgi:hypothetical protein
MTRLLQCDRCKRAVASREASRWEWARIRPASRDGLSVDEWIEAWIDVCPDCRTGEERAEHDNERRLDEALRRWLDALEWAEGKTTGPPGRREGDVETERLRDRILEVGEEDAFREFAQELPPRSERVMAP